jgi:membrane-associated phospholipid phosphatase
MRLKPRRPGRTAFALTLAYALVALPARADEPVKPLRYDLAIDGAVTLAGGTAWILSELFKKDIVPSGCGWCDDNAFDRGVREALVWSNPGTADSISNVLGFAVLPVGALGLDALAAAHEKRLDAWPVDALVVLESVMIAADLNQVTKFAFRRERPFVHALPHDAVGHLVTPTSDPADDDLSFFSGHTTLAFALASSVGTVATLRGYRAAPVLWATLMPLAAFIGYLRIAADKHYATDVLTGALVGGAVGFAVPYLFHRPDAPVIGVSAAPTGARGTSFTASFVW